MPMSGAGAARHPSELPPRPEPPLPGECCGRGCENCVWVYYERALQRWEERVAALAAEGDRDSAGCD